MPIERAQSGGDAEPHEDREKRDHREQRHDRAQRHAGGELAPHAHGLRDLHHLVAGDGGQHAPFAGGVGDGAKAALEHVRQPPLRLRQVDLDAVAVPDLDDQAVAARGAARADACREGHACDRRRHLRQLVVEERVGLLARPEIRGDRADDHGGGEANYEPTYQLATDRARSRRAHGAGSSSPRRGRS
jgi:hypothetical protein